MAESTIFSRRSGSVQGISGGVERLLNLFREKSERLKESPTLEKLREEEVSDSEAGKRGKVVLYITSVKAVRSTHEQCKQVLHILRSHRVLFASRDVFLHPDYSRELAERMGQPKNVTLPQLFVGGKHIGNGEVVTQMNEDGRLEQLLKDYKSDSCLVDCGQCGGNGFVLCLWCGGSKKGIKNAFNDLKCTVCNQNGLQLCPQCSQPHS